MSRWVVDFISGEMARAVGRSRSRPATARQALAQWLGELGNPPPVKGRVLVTALRNETWIEWAVYCACVVRGMGYASVLLYSGAQIRKRYPARVRVLDFWSGVGSVPDIELVDIDQLPRAPRAEPGFERVALESAPSALAYDLHVEEADILDNPGVHGAALAALRAGMVRSGAAVSAWLDTRVFHRFFLYSGIINTSPALLHAAREHKLPTFCLEGWSWRPGHLIYNVDAPALEYNVSGWLNALGPWDAAKEAEISAYLKFLEGHKTDDAQWLENFYLIQKAKVTEELPPALARFLAGDAPVFLLTPNVIGDSSILRRETIFRGQRLWAEEVICHFRNHPDRKLVIRAHPGEQWLAGKCSIHMARVATEAAGGAPNIMSIDSSEKVNTLSLFPFARAGLVWTSSVGVDMVVRGVPAVAAASPKYSGMGIVEEPATKEAYFAWIDRLAARAERPDAGRILAGKRYLHFAFKGFSFEATARNYRASGCRLNHMPNQAEHDRFYRILVGEEPAPDQSVAGLPSAPGCPV